MLQAHEPLLHASCQIKRCISHLFVLRDPLTSEELIVAIESSQGILLALIGGEGELVVAWLERGEILLDVQIGRLLLGGLFPTSLECVIGEQIGG
jgi:hypothetical protein